MPRKADTKAKITAVKRASKAISQEKAETSVNSPRTILRGKIAGTDVAIVARRGSYRAANNPRSRVQTPYGGSGDQHVDPWSRRIVRELSRDMERNADSYRSLLDDWVRWQVGDGVKAVFRTESEDWNRKATDLLHKKFSAVRDGIDCRGINNWYQLQAKFVRAVAMDGDAAIVKLKNFTVQLAESEQITSGLGSMSYGPDMYCDGIKMNKLGKPTQFTICPYDVKTGSLNFGLSQSYDPEMVEFSANTTRISQTRGMPLLVAGLEDWERIDSYKESEIIAAEQGSLIYAAVEYPEGQMGFGKTYLPGNPAPGGPVDGSTPSAGYNGGWNNQGQVDWHGNNAGFLMELPNGAKYVPINPQRPSKDAAPFMIEMLRQFCTNAGLPYEIVYNDLRGLSWSVHRGMIALARDKVRINQKLIFENCFREIAKWAIANLIEDGELEEVEDFDCFDLCWPQLSWPDEGKEYEAQTLGLTKGLTTRHRVFGHDWRTMLDERMEEIEYASELCVAFNKKYADSEDSTKGDKDFDENSPEEPDVLDVEASRKFKAAFGKEGKSSSGDGSKEGSDGKATAPGAIDSLTGLPMLPKKPNHAGFRITPQELLGYVDFKDDSSGAGAGKVGHPKDGSKVGGADELKTKTPRKDGDSNAA